MCILHPQNKAHTTTNSLQSNFYRVRLWSFLRWFGCVEIFQDLLIIHYICQFCVILNVSIHHVDYLIVNRVRFNSVHQPFLFHKLFTINNTNLVLHIIKYRYSFSIRWTFIEYYCYVCRTNKNETISKLYLYVTHVFVFCDVQDVHIFELRSLYVHYIYMYVRIRSYIKSKLNI